MSFVLCSYPTNPSYFKHLRGGTLHEIQYLKGLFIILFFNVFFAFSPRYMMMLPIYFSAVIIYPSDKSYLLNKEAIKHSGYAVYLLQRMPKDFGNSR